MFDWDKLLNGLRRKNIGNVKCAASGEDVDSIKTADRTEIERDYDRVVFSAPTRRLANKTQVFPMEENDSIRTRLTHSYEVSNLARGAGVQLCCNGFFDNIGIHESVLIREVPALLASIGLMHDMGNPPFGHQGEKAIRDWFGEKLSNELRGLASSSKDLEDFKSFDGNAQTIRLVTRLHSADGLYGMNLTVATLAAMIKYPALNSTKNNPYEKPGVFESEREVVSQVWAETGLKEKVRHPLTYIMEACDDIAYATIDVEDTIKKGYASFNDLKRWLEEKNSDSELFTHAYDKIKETIDEYRDSNGVDITSDVENEVSIEIFRALVINKLLKEATDKFKDDFHDEANKDWFCDGEGKVYEVVKRFKYSSEVKELKGFSRYYGFNNSDVLRRELEGQVCISEMMTFLWEGIKGVGIDDDSGELVAATHYEKYILSKLSRNYLHEYRRKLKDRKCECEKTYAKFQLIADSLSGMTEAYLKRMHAEIKPLYMSSKNEKSTSS